MSKMIQLRHVPDDLHRKLKARAALVGLPLSDYLLQEVRRVAERPTIAELRSRLAHRSAVTPTVSPAKAVRAERDGR
jgi:plasmid stability protein